MTTELQGRSTDQATEAAGRLCWSCNAAVAADAHFCAACGKVQPASSTDHFRCFGLSRKLNLDEAWLEKEFYRLSRRLHPDVYARSSTDEQAWSLEKSSRLNDAYRTLRDPIARTQYLLEREGFKLEEQSSSATQAARDSGEEKRQVVPPELLEEVFELNMQLQELRMSKAAGDADDDALAGLQAARTSFQQKLAALDTELRSLWNHWDAVESSSDDASRRKVLENMVALLNRRSYVRNLVRDVTAELED
jgi:molecular chaperone HscB